MAGENKNYLSFAQNLARAAAQKTLPLFRTHHTVHWKTPQQPTTSADLQAEEVMREMIRARYPHHGIIAEEGKDVPPQSPYTWILDPVDGTRSFMCGSPLWSTLIGLYKNGSPCLGVLHQPFTQEWFVASRLGATSVFYRHKNKKQLLGTHKDVVLKKAILGTTSPDLLPQNGGFKNLALKTQFTVYGGDAYLYGLLSLGFLDLVVEAGLKRWDVLPLVPIIEEAGGVVSDWHGNALWVSISKK